MYEECLAQAFEKVGDVCNELRKNIDEISSVYKEAERKAKNTSPKEYEMSLNRNVRKGLKS